MKAKYLYLLLLTAATAGNIHAETFESSEPLPTIERQEPMLTQIRHLKHPKYTGQGEVGEDNKDRRDKILDQSLELFHLRNSAWRVISRLSQYKETDFPSVKENAIGGGLNLQMGLYHNLDGYGAYNAFSSDDNDVKDTHSVGGTLGSHWTDNVRTLVKVDRVPVYTARALNKEITQVKGELALIVNFFELWRVGMVGRHADLSDDNRRNSGNFSLSKYLGRRHGPSIEYRYTYDNMENLIEEYYSPQDLNQHQLGFDFPFRWEKDFQFHISYLPGFGKEEGADDHIVHSFNAELRKTWMKRLTLGVAGAYATTPTYRSARTRLTLEYRI